MRIMEGNAKQHALLKQRKLNSLRISICVWIATKHLHLYVDYLKISYKHEGAPKWFR
jgi:hypothetical protein